MKERQPVKGLKKQNGGESGYRNISERSKSGKKLSPETHMESQDHLQNAIEYLRKYQKESIGVGDIEPDNTHTANHDVDDDNPRPRSVKVSSPFGSKGNWWPAGYRGTPKIFLYTGKILQVVCLF